MLRRTPVLASIVAALAVAPPALAADSHQPGETLLVGRPTGLGALPAQSDGPSHNSTRAISANGRFTVFVSEADDLGAGDQRQHAYARDDQTGAVTLLDRAGAGGPAADSEAHSVTISADGSRACFVSRAGNLVGGADGTHSHAYVVTIATGAIAAVDRSAAGIGNDDANDCSLDADGNTVAFRSVASNLVNGASGGHIYVRHLDTNTTELVDSYQGTPSNGEVYSPSIDATGGSVAFATMASNLLGPGGDQNGVEDVYVRNLGIATPILVSRADTVGGAIGNGASWGPSISADGERIAFTSQASNLGDGDADTISDVHVRDLFSGATKLISRADGAAGAKGNDRSEEAEIAGDGTAVAFTSEASNLGAALGQTHSEVPQRLYVRTLATSHTTVVDRASGASGELEEGAGGNTPSLDQHATNVVFTSNSGNLDSLATGIFPEVFQRHLAGGFETRLISRPADASGRPAPLGPISDTKRAISADGRFVVFSTPSPFGGPAGTDEVYVRDVLLGTTQLVSRADGADGAAADDDSFGASISADGTKVAFATYATNLSSAGGDSKSEQVYVRDLNANTTALVSVATGGGRGDRASWSPVLSQDGTRIAFASAARDLVPGDVNDQTDIFVRDMPAGTTTLASLTASGGQANAYSDEPMISADGTRVGFGSSADLGAGVADGRNHVYVRDLVAGTTTLVDRAADGSPAGDQSGDATMSADGNRFEFVSNAKLTPDATATPDDIYVRDVAAGTTKLVSLGAAGEHSASFVSAGAISLDGTKASFESYRDAFHPGDHPAEWVRDLQAGTSTLISNRDSSSQDDGESGSGSATLNADGNCAIFASANSSLGSPSFAGSDMPQLWLHVVAGECPVHAPDTAITSGPDGSKKVRTAVSTFAYQGDESNVGFACSLDGSPATSCGDSFATPKLRDGVHRFSVAAIDHAGNADPTPALATFTVGVPPRVTKLRIDRRGRIVFRLSEKAKVRVRVAHVSIRRSFKAGTRHVKLPLKHLRKGRHVVTVTATDAGGNRSVPKRKRFTVGGAVPK
jgi:Tol biopolymer transport system component